VLTLLEKSTKAGKTLIITNARKGWVEFSSSFMLPKAHKYILKHVEVISARENFEHKYPHETHMWKEKTF
jgi:hypothetical protein